MEIRLTEKGTAAAIEKLNALPEKLDAAIAKGLSRGLLIAVGVVQNDFLSGPRPTHIQSITGRLRIGVQSSVEVTPNRIIGRIGDNVPYAGYHEFGFHGVVNVKAFTRVVGQHFAGKNDAGTYLDSVRGTRRQVVSDKGEVLGFRESRKRAAGRQRTGFVQFENVRAHQRRVDYSGKPYVAPALKQSIPVILEEIKNEVAALK